jgi:hypothetical protein
MKIGQLRPVTVPDCLPRSGHRLLAVGCQGVHADSVRYRSATFHRDLTEEDRADWH